MRPPSILPQPRPTFTREEQTDTDALGGPALLLSFLRVILCHRDINEICTKTLVLSLSALPDNSDTTR